MKNPAVALLGLLSILLFSLPAWAGGRTFKARLTGAAEVPPVETRARGKAEFKAYRTRDGAVLKFELRVRMPDPVGLLGENGAHIHCGGPTDNGPVRDGRPRDVRRRSF